MTPTVPAPTETVGPSSTSQQASEHIPVTTRDLLTVMDVVRSLSTTWTDLAERMARAEVTLAHNHAIPLQIQSHLGLPPVSVTEPTQPTTRDQSVVSAAAASDPSASPPAL